MKLHELLEPPCTAHNTRHPYTSQTLEQILESVEELINADSCQHSRTHEQCTD